MTPRVLFLVYRDSLGPIFSSVYLKPAAALSRRGIDTGILAVCSLGEFVKPRLRRRWENLIQGYDGLIPQGVARIPSPPHRARALWSDQWLFERWAVTRFRRWFPHIIHCGGGFASHMAIRLRQRHPQIKVVYHSWGPEADEVTFPYRASGNVPRKEAKRAKELERVQAAGMRGANSVINISHAMEQWAIERYGLARERSVVIPCYVDTEQFDQSPTLRLEVRRDLGVSDGFVVVYCGSILPWQLGPASLSLLTLVREIHPATYFLGVTMHGTSLKRLLDEVGFPQERTRIIEASPSDVSRYLAAGDLGMLGRGLMQKADVVNGVSSPIKYGEYLASGTPVLISEGIGDFSTLTEERRLGVVVKNGANGAHARDLLKAFIDDYLVRTTQYRQRCKSVAKEVLDIQRHLGTLGGLYQDLTHAQELPRNPDRV